MPTAKLTTRDIKGFVYQGSSGSRDVRWDRSLPGFGVRIYPTGRKAFLVSYRAEGQKRMMVLGDFGSMTLDQARRRAKKLFVNVEDGQDPLLEKQRAAHGQTMGDLIDRYIKDHAIGPRGEGDPHKRTWRADQRRLNRHIPTAWRGRKVSAIKRHDVAELHNRIGANTPYEANRLLEVLRKMFNLAPGWGFVEETAANPARGIEKFRERARKRWVKPEELPAIGQAIDQEPNVYVRAAIWLFLLTGLRKSELLQAKWDDVDWNRGVLRLPDTKSDEEQSATLSGPALAFLQAIPRQEGNPHILVGSRAGSSLINVDRPWHRIRKSAGTEDIRLHDLRRTVGSWLTQSGVDLNLIKDALRHASLSTTLIYSRLGADAARDAMEAYGQRILEAAGKRGPREVVQGPGGKR